MYAEITKSQNLKVKLEDMNENFTLMPIKSSRGTKLLLTNVLAKDMELQTLEDGSVQENPNGMCLFKLKTNDENFKELYFIYECGFYLDWEISDCRGRVETKRNENYDLTHMTLFNKYTLELKN